MLEELVKRGISVAKAGGGRGWALVRLDDMSLVGIFEAPKDAKKAAKGAGVYLLVKVGA